MSDKRQVMYDIERCICHVPDACRDCSHSTVTVGFACMENLMSDVLALLKQQDAVVRCRDCKHWRKLLLNHDGCGVCHADNSIRVSNQDWYCADGERKEVTE